MTTTTSDSAAKKDIQKLQRVIVDALEDVKAQEIVVFDTEKQTALFERVMIASGTSNRQTRALAMSVRDAVNKAGFGKPRVEGEDNGEWIIVDCGSAVVHVMQPAIRSYYHLEELWGDIPVRLKFGSEKVAVKSAAKKTPAKKLTATQEAMIQIDKGDKAEKPMTLKRSNAAKAGVAEAFPSKAAIKKEAAIKSTKAAAAKKIAAKTPAAKKAAAKKIAVKSTAEKTATSATSVVPAKKVAAKKAPAKKVAAKKA